ncbi:MAG: HEAT repeat domain-containing protein [Planctomycetes bacterium]|nr:HEAT repeat domain-containing protein [Planctomycetota bacterium]
MRSVVFGSLCACLVAGIAGQPAARADVVTLRTGRRVEGKATVEGQRIRVRIGEDREVFLRKGDVQSIERGPAPFEIYREKSEALASDDVKGRLALAKWAASKGLTAEAGSEYRKVIEIAPDHAEAREGLGFVRDGDEWVTAAEFHRRRGEVYEGGRWVAREEIEARKRAAQRAAEIRRAVDRAATRTGKAQEEALTFLASLSPEEETEALLKGLSGSTQVKRFAMERLGEGKVGAAVPALAERVIKDSSGEIRRRALRALHEIDHPDTALAFIPSLSSSSEPERIRAARSLAYFPDRRAVGAIIETFHYSWSGFPRGYVMVGVTQAYISDYELVSGGTGWTLTEVADPVIGYATYGVVLDADVRRVEAAVRIVTLEAITGKHFGGNLDSWVAWWELESAAQKARKEGAEPKEEEEA